jgi:hypothetical protein
LNLGTDVENNRRGVTRLQREDAHSRPSGRALRAGVKVLIDQFLMVMQEMSERFRVRQTASA